MPRFVPCNRGWIESISGPMFSGKSEELIRRLVRSQISGQKVKVYKPSIDKRFSETKIVSRSGSKFNCSLIDSSSLYSAFLDLIGGELDLDADVYGFDEVQFFEKEAISTMCNLLADKGKRVITAGLDTDYLGIPFESSAEIMAIADFTDKVSAICMDCGDIATKTARTVKSDDKILVGDTEAYLAVCRKCHKKYKGG